MHVLVVDDDAAVRSTFARALTQIGFSAHEAATPVDALAVLKKQPMNAIICDFAMPGMDGSTFHQRLLEVAPDVADRIVFVTGWAKDPKTRKLLDHTGQPLLEKPVELNDLITHVRRTAGA
ncbi:MAG: response regulator [Gemmatimonadales bacterium]